MMQPPSIRLIPWVREELTDRLWAAVQAICAGYRWIDRKDGIQLILLKLAYHDAEGGFLPTAAALELQEPWYEDMAR